MKVSLLLLASVSSAAASLKRYRLLQTDQHKEVTSPPVPAPDRLVPHGINGDGDECSCSPIKFTFRLALSQDCSNDDIEANAGIDSTYCTVDEYTDKDGEPIRRLESTMPVEITSVQFLEFGRGTLEVMYTDDSYLNTSLVDGDTVTFYSSSAYLPTVPVDEQEDYVSGGVSLILTGKAEDGTAVRNRFYWLYDEGVTDCFENLFLPGVYKGDAIGWVVTDEVSGPWPQFCPAASPTSPTINPRTITPTSYPSSAPEGLPTHGIVSSKSSKGHDESSKSSKSSNKSGKVDVDAKADKDGDYSSKSLKGSGHTAAASISMSMTDSPSSAPSESMSYASPSTYFTAKSGKALYDSKAVKESSSKSSKSGYRMIGSKSPSGSAVFSKSGKSAKSMSFSMSSPTSSPSESASPSEKAVFETEARKQDSTKAYKLLNPKTNKDYNVSSKSSKANVHPIGSVSMSYSSSMPSSDPTVSPYPSSSYTVTVVHTGKSGKGARNLMSEYEAADARGASKKSGKAEQMKSSKSSKSLPHQTSMSYSEHPSVVPSESPSASLSPSHHYNSAKSGKHGSKSSKSSPEVSHTVSSKSSKVSTDFSKSSKSLSYESISMSFSISMPSSAPSVSTTPSSTIHIIASGKTEKHMIYTKADKYSSKSSKSDYRYISAKGSVTLSKSSKGSLDTADRSYSMSMPSSAPSESFSPTTTVDINASGKSGKQEFDAKAEKHDSSKSSKTYRSVSAKSNKGDEYSKSSKGANLSYSMSIPSTAPSESIAPTDEMVVDSKASRYSGKGYKLMKPKSIKDAGMVFVESSKSSKAEQLSTDMSNSSVESTAPSASGAPTQSGKSSKESIGKSGKSQVVTDVSMSYSMSMEISSKSGKADSSVAQSRVRRLSSERTAMDDVDCNFYECVNCRAVFNAPTVDGEDSDWTLIEGYESKLTGAIDQREYLYGKLNTKCVHDGTHVYFLFQVPGPFRFDPNNEHKSPAVSTMMQIGSDATLNHGNCPQAKTSCSEDPSLCDNFKVDLGGYWKTSQTQMGVKYGVNEEAGDGDILDEYATGVNCHEDDDEINHWSAAWSHNSPTEGDLGMYTFEMSRPLKTDSPATDAQLELGTFTGFGFAYWHSYQLASGWTHQSHYITGSSEDWLYLRLLDEEPTNTPAPINPSTESPSLNPTHLGTQSPTNSPIDTSAPSVVNITSATASPTPSPNEPSTVSPTAPPSTRVVTTSKPTNKSPKSPPPSNEPTSSPSEMLNGTSQLHNDKIDPDDEAAWAEYSLITAVSKSSKNSHNTQSLSMHAMSVSNKAGKSESAPVAPSKFNSKSSKSDELPFAKSSKTDLSAYEDISSKPSTSDFVIVPPGTKSSKNQYSHSYSLSVPSQNINLEKGQTSPKKDIYLPSTKPHTSSSSPNIDMELDSRDPNPNQIRLVNNASSKSLTATFVFILFQFVI